MYLGARCGLLDGFSRRPILRLVGVGLSLAGCLALSSILAGCTSKKSPTIDRADISKSLAERTGSGLRKDPPSIGVAVPPGVSLEDGLLADEAVALALWNNAEFRASLASLGLARADLIQAGLLRNPILSLLFPIGPKQLEATVTWSIDALWQRPRRVAAAQLDLDQLAENLVQYGLDLARRAKSAHSDLLLAQDRLSFGNEAVNLEKEIARLTELRFTAGDISELEATGARDQVSLAEREASRFEFGVAHGMNQLRFVLGLEASDEPIKALNSPLLLKDLPELNELLTDAFASRPDLRAAELTMQAAGERLGLEERSIWRIAAVLDINGEGREGFEAGPGVLMEIPIFDTNQAGKDRARAQMERAMRQYVAVQHRISNEIQDAKTRFAEASLNYRVWRDEILPLFEETLRLAEAAFSAGEVSYLYVLGANRRLVQGRLEMASAAAALRQATLDLDRGIGRSRFANP